MKYILFILITCSLFAGGAGEYQKLSGEYRTFLKGKQTRRGWLNLIKKFEQHAQKYHREKIAAKSHYTAGTLAYKLYQTSKRQTDLNRGIKQFKTLCKKHPNSSLSDDSCYLLYTIYFQYFKDHERAKYYAKYIIDHYPSGDTVHKATAFLKKFYPKHLEKQKTSSRKKQKKQLITTQLLKNKIKITINTPKNEGAKIGEVKVDGALTKIFIDLKGKHFRKKHPIKLIHPILEKIRFGQYKKNVGRIVLDFRATGNYRVLNRGKKLILELRSGENDQKTIQVAAIPPKKKDIDLPKTPVVIHAPLEKVTAIKRPKKLLNKPTIIIDPGHGGKDPGAVGKIGKKIIKEKDITLSVALKLQKLLKKSKKYNVILTRTTDKNISLDTRTDIANDQKGDLFISLHVNAIPIKRFYGIETFYLNLAADNYSRRLESVENAEHQKKITDLQFILADLLKKANTKESIQLANYIQSSLIFNLRRKYKKIRNLGVKNAMFYVLLDTKMPSVLVELGFISNKYEVKRLNTQRYQQKLAESLSRGVNNYFQKRTTLRSSR